MKIINNLVIAFMEEANKFEGSQKEELLNIINKIDIGKLPTEHELKKDPRKIKIFLKYKDEMQTHFSEFGRKYEEFSGDPSVLDKIIEENNKL